MTHTKNLIETFQVVHEGLKKFSCDMCDKKYASKIDLKYHLKKIHGKVILFECTLCEQKFDQRKLLMSHITEVHQPQDLLPAPEVQAAVATATAAAAVAT